jgi:hypothetical protein
MSPPTPRDVDRASPRAPAPRRATRGDDDAGDARDDGVAVTRANAKNENEANANRTARASTTREDAREANGNDGKTAREPTRVRATRERAMRWRREGNIREMGDLSNGW